MENQLGLAVAALLLIPSVLFLLINSFKNSKKYKNLPPSPPSLPVIGHLHHLGTELPHRALQKLAKKYGPLMHLRLGNVLAIVVSSREGAKELLKSRDPLCADRPESIGSEIMWYDYRDIIFSPYNDYWRQMRKICMIELLSTKNVRSFSSIRQDEALKMIESIRATSGQPVNFTETILAFTCAITCRTAFGKVMTGRHTLSELLKKAAAMAAGYELADLFPALSLFSMNKYKLLKMRREMDSILDVIVEEHELKQRGEFGGEDIVDVLLRLKQTGDLQFPIERDNIKAVIFDVFSAGSETSSTTVDWAMAELMQNPRVMAKVQAELREAFKGKKEIDESDIQSLNYLKLVIKETLRLHPPFPMLLRATREESELNGYTIPHKAKIIVNNWAMGRDPEYWHEPESFQPERFETISKDFLGNNFEYLPFGAGKRICPGLHFGLANVELPLAQLLYHFDWKFPQGMTAKDIDLTETEGLALSRKNGLFIVPTTYNPSS